MTNLCLVPFILCSDSLNTSLPITSAVQNSTYTTSAITSSSLTESSLSSTSPVTISSYDQSSLHSRIAYQSSVSPSESAPGTVMVRGLPGFLYQILSRVQCVVWEIKLFGEIFFQTLASLFSGILVGRWICQQWASCLKPTFQATVQRRSAWLDPEA